MMLSKKYILNGLLILLLIADIDYSFRQHEHKTLDGDMSLISAPSKNYTTVLQEPFGFKALFDQEKYAGSNRYYAHFAMYTYYNKIYPVFSGFFRDKVDYLYKFTGLFQMLMQLLLIALLIYYATNNIKTDNTKILFLIVLITSLFQTHGYSNSVGVIDHSVTYTFFYAMPLAGLLIFLIPYLRHNMESYSGKVKIVFGIFWLYFGFTLSMTGALIPVLGIIICGLICCIVVFNFFKTRKFKSEIHFPVFTVITLLSFLLSCAYSYYISTFNSENAAPIPLSLRYEKLFEGLKHYFIQDISFLLIALLLMVNYILIKRNKIKITNYVWLMLLISVVYIFLLPLGGYRPYRPYIIRNDTFLPVTLMLFYLIARSTIIVLSKTKFTKNYLFFILIGIGIFTYADKPHFDEDRCQRNQIKRLQESKEELTILPSDCPILTWDCTKDTQWTIDGSRMLNYWQITDRIKVYRHE